MVNVFFFVPYVLGPYATVLQTHHLVDVAPVRRPGTMIKILKSYFADLAKTTCASRDRPREMLDLVASMPKTCF